MTVSEPISHVERTLSDPPITRPTVAGREREPASTIS